MPNYESHSSNKYEKPEVPNLTQRLEAVSQENDQHMAEVKTAYDEKKSSLLGGLAVRKAEKSLRQFAGQNMEDLHQLAIVEDAQRDLEEWKRPKDVSEFTDEEMAQAMELLTRVDEYKNNQANKDELERAIKGARDPRDELYDFEGKAQQAAIESLGLDEGETHRRAQAIEAYYRADRNQDEPRAESDDN